jgi:hypothetical protein
VSHSLVLGLFPSAAQAAIATGALHDAGFTRDAISLVARSHAEAIRLARDMGASPGVEIEDSRPAGRLGELSAAVVAAAAVVLPGVGPIVAVGPLSAELGEAVGHLAGGLAHVLTSAGVDHTRALAWQTAVGAGQVLVGVHAADGSAPQVQTLLREQGATAVDTARWDGDLP